MENHSRHLHAKAYLFVKPILTSEKDAIKEAVESARYAEGVGASRVSFCPATIHKGTLMEIDLKPSYKKYE